MKSHSAANLRGSEERRQGKSDPRKVSVYFEEELIREMRAQARRTDRSVSWLLRRAWMAYRERAKAIPEVKA